MTDQANATVTKQDGHQASLIDIELPEVLGEDPERERLAHQFRIQEGALSAVLRRPGQICENLAGLTGQYVDGDERQRKRLLAEPTALAAELTLLPAETGIAAQRYASTLLAWTRHVYIRAEAINNRLVDELNPLLRARHRLQESISDTDVATDGDDREQRIAALNAERRDQIQAFAPLRKRQSEVLEFLQGIDARLSLKFKVDCNNGTADESAVARWVTAIRRGVERACNG